MTIEDVGNSGLFLLSDLGSGVTGEIMHVDSGYHTVGMCSVDSAAATAELLQGIAPKKGRKGRLTPRLVIPERSEGSPASLLRLVTAKGDPSLRSG